MTIFALSLLVAARWAILLAIAIGAMCVDSQVAGSPTGATTRATNTGEPETASRFEPVSIVIDPHGSALAAYQVEIRTGADDATLVGVEGGEAPAFSQPPYYDARALQSGHIILAAYSTSATLPQAATRVATVMVHVPAGVHPHYSATLVVAADHDAKPINATVSVQPTPANDTPAGTTSTLYPGGANSRRTEGAKQ